MMTGASFCQDWRDLPQGRALPLPARHVDIRQGSYLRQRGLDKLGWRSENPEQSPQKMLRRAR